MSTRAADCLAAIERIRAELRAAESAYVRVLRLTDSWGRAKFCFYCGEPVPKNKTGRPRISCSKACAKAWTLFRRREERKHR